MMGTFFIYIKFVLLLATLESNQRQHSISKSKDAVDYCENFKGSRQIKKKRGSFLCLKE